MVGQDSEGPPRRLVPADRHWIAQIGVQKNVPGAQGIQVNMGETVLRETLAALVSYVRTSRWALAPESRLACARPLALNSASAAMWRRALIQSTARCTPRASVRAQPRKVSQLGPKVLASSVQVVDILTDQGDDLGGVDPLARGIGARQQDRDEHLVR